MKPEARDRTMGLSILGVAFLGALCISWWASVASSPETAPPPAPPTTEGVAGFPNGVDVIGTLDAAHGVSVRDNLRGISASGVASDGTVDVTRKGSKIRYVFQSERGEGPQPPHPKGTLQRRTYCGRQDVIVDAKGLVAEEDEPRRHCGGDGGHELPDPRCGPKEVWDYALKNKRVPRGKLADIEYYGAHAGPAWRFKAGRYRFTLYGDCERELSGRDTRGSVP